MPVIQRSALVPHPPEAMFDLVADIERYPEFLPWCRAARTLERTDASQVASVSVAKRLPGIGTPEFTTRNRLERPGRIDMDLVDGPFRHLRGTWRFVPAGAGGCRAELEIDFEFASRIVGRVIAPGFERVCDTVVDAFVERAARTLPDGGGAAP